MSVSDTLTSTSARSEFVTVTPIDDPCSPNSVAVTTSADVDCVTTQEYDPSALASHSIFPVSSVMTAASLA